MRFSGVHASRTLDKRGMLIKYILQTYNIKIIFGGACPPSYLSLVRSNTSGESRGGARGPGPPPPLEMLKV